MIISLNHTYRHETLIVKSRVRSSIGDDVSSIRTFVNITDRSLIIRDPDYETHNFERVHRNRN